MSLPYNKNNITYAKELRKNATRFENHLWYDYLKNYPIRFQRQKAIDSFIADFYCDYAKLVIELDGVQHTTHEIENYDRIRTNILKKYGLEVIRLYNYETDGLFEETCLKIDETVKARIKTLYGKE